MRGCEKNVHLRKTWMIMKLTTFLFFLGVMQMMASEAYSQTTKMTLQLSDATVKEVLNRIEEKSEFFFLYNSKLVDVNRKVSVDAKDQRIDEILNNLFQETGVVYTVVDRQIVLTSKDDQAGFVGKSGQQQGKKVSGKVTDQTGAPVPGVAIVVKGTTIGITSDNGGNYSLSLPSDASVLVFSFIGMKTQEITVGGKATINITLADETIGIEEVIAIGYGTQKKASLTAAVSNMKTEQIASIPTSNLSNVLAGRLSGTSIISSTGTPGISSSIRVRSTSSWNGGESIYVIDGVVRDKVSFDALDPNEVEEISILKDAASAAIYGSRSSNGVVLVKTKSGKSGKAAIEFTSMVGSEQIAKLPPRMNIYDAMKLDQTIMPISDEEVAWVVKNNPTGLNAFNQMYEHPYNQKYAVSVSGGNDKVTYYMGGSFYDEKGFLPHVAYKKYNLRGKISANLTKDLTVSLNLNNSYGTRTRFNWAEYGSGNDDLSGTWNRVIDWWPLFDPGYVNGKPVSFLSYGSWMQEIKNGGYWRSDNQQMDALMTASYKVPFVKGLTATLSYSKNIVNNLVKSFAQKQLLYTVETAGANNRIFTDKITGTIMSAYPSQEGIGNEYYKTNSYQLNAQLSYNHSFGKHNINADAVYEQYELNSNNFSAYRYNFPIFAKDQFFAASGNSANWSTNGSEYQDGRLSYIFRAGYDFAGTYLLSASLRRDGSMKFAPAQRWGNFPSISTGWVLSHEDFYQRMKVADIIKFAKLRFSYGSTGSDAIGGWQWQDQYNISTGTYYRGTAGTTAPRLTYGGIPNENLTWEKSDSYDLGIDLELFKGLSFSGDLWKRHTYDILGFRILALPSEFGGALPADNYGIVDSKGYETELTYKHSIGKDFSFAIKGNFSFATNKVIKKDVAANAQAVSNPNGKTLSYGWGYESLGMLRTQADLDKLPAGMTYFGTKPALGSLNFRDASGPDNKPDGKVDSYDMVTLGDYFGAGSAPYTYGLTLSLSYKGFNLETQLAGLAGFKINYSNTWGRAFAPFNGDNVPIWYENSWTPQNPNGTFPLIHSPWTPEAYSYEQTSTFTVYKGDFARLKYINLTYSLPMSIVNKIGLKGISVFVAGNNLFYVSKFKYYDPELSSSMSYPTMRTFSTGLTVKL